MTKTARLVLAILAVGALATLGTARVAEQHTPAPVTAVATPGPASATPISPITRPAPISVPALP